MSKNSSLKREAKKQRDIPQEHKTSDVVVFERKRKQLEPLNESQRQFISALKHDKIVIGAGSAGTGKAQPLKSKVLTSSGWVKIGDIRVGDEVVCPDGSTSRVNGVYPQGIKNTYNFVFEDGREVECCTEHLWKLDAYYKEDGFVWTAQQIKEHQELVSRKHFRSKRVPLVNHPNIPPKPLPLDPYFVGAMLGDGCVRGSVSFTTVDEQIIEQMPLHDDYEYVVSKHDPITRYIRKKSRGNKSNLYIDLFKQLGIYNKLSFDKSIPRMYIEGTSYDQKIRLIQGLLDTDGGVENGSLYFYTSSPQLKDDFVELIRSIGGIAFEKNYNLSQRESYRIRVRYKDPRQLVTLDRKKNLISVDPQYAKCGLAIDQILDAGPQECICISVDHPDHLYITDNYVVTHNTYLSSRIAGELYLQSKNFKQIILTRPNVEAGEKLGYLPGELHEKYEPYMEPFKDGLIDQLGAKFQSDLYKKILPQPLGYMRGRTFDDSLILLDEAQNISVTLMKLIITRVGTNSRLFITGDTKQCDLKGREMNGLEWLISEIERQQKPIEVVRFRKEDCVRSDECKMMLDLIENSEL